MTKIISLINLKGGVGKTTTTIQLAECLAGRYGYNVLVIDLDPQTNATIALISEEKWEQLDSEGKTLYQLFADKLEDTERFNIESAIQKNVSTLLIPKLHLLASSTRFLDIQDRIKDIPEKTGNTMAMEVLKLAIQPVLNRYNYVLIDCPPNLNYITQNGLEISDYYLIPTIPDKLSTYGIPQIIKQISRFAKTRTAKVKCLGLVVTKYDSRSSSQKKGLDDLPGKFKKAFDDLGIPNAPVFKTVMPQATATARAMDYEAVLDDTFRSKYGQTTSDYQTVYSYVMQLTSEFLKHAEQS